MSVLVKKVKSGGFIFRGNGSIKKRENDGSSEARSEASGDAWDGFG